MASAAPSLKRSSAEVENRPPTPPVPGTDASLNRPGVRSFKLRRAILPKRRIDVFTRGLELVLDHKNKRKRIEVYDGEVITETEGKIVNLYV